MLNFGNIFSITNPSKQIPNPDLERQMIFNHSQYESYLAKCSDKKERQELKDKYVYFRKTISVIDTIETMINDYDEAFHRSSYYMKRNKFHRTDQIKILKLILDFIYNRVSHIKVYHLLREYHTPYRYIPNQNDIDDDDIEEFALSCIDSFKDKHRDIVYTLHYDLEKLYTDYTLNNSKSKKFNTHYINNLYNYIENGICLTVFNYGRLSPHFHKIFDYAL